MSKIKNLKLKLKKKQQNLLISVILAITFGILGTLIFNKYFGVGGKPSYQSVDLSFDQWEISGSEAPQRYIKEIEEGYYGTCIEVRNEVYRTTISARLSFDTKSKGELTFQVKTPTGSKKGGFKLELQSDNSRIIMIWKDKYSVKWYGYFEGSPFIFLTGYDNNWHTFKINYEINGDNSTISVEVDRSIKIDAQQFSCDVEYINSIYIAPAKWFTPSLTYIHFESLKLFS